MRKHKDLITGILFILAGCLELANPHGGDTGLWGALNNLVKETFGIYSMAILFFCFGIGALYRLHF